jgi:hypothetical protein
VVFKVGEREYRCDALIFSSIVMEKTKENEEPSRETVLGAMREALETSEGLNDHQLFAMSVRMAKAMANAGKE